MSSLAFHIPAAALSLLASLTSETHSLAVCLVGCLFLIGAQSRFKSPSAYLTPNLHGPTNLQTGLTHDAELVRPVLYFSPETHPRVVGALMGLCGMGTLTLNSVVKKWSLCAGSGWILWGFVNRYRAGLDMWKFSDTWVVLMDMLLVWATLP